MPRPISAVHIPPDFEKTFFDYLNGFKRLATQKDKWFRNDAFDRRLRTHKTQGQTVRVLVLLR